MANYEDRIVCFLDILGFKEHVKKSSKDPSKVADIIHALEAIRRILSIDSEDDIEKDGANITQFSDSIVLSFDYNYKSGVFWTLLKLLWVQASLVKHGMLVRGAIVRDEFIHQSDLMFGQGLIRAYEIESKAAVYPRVLVAKEVLEAGIEHAEHNPKQEAEYLERLINKDEDGLYYIDYFSLEVAEEFDDPEIEYIEYLQGIRKIILENKDTDSIGITSKYGWVTKKYHDNLDKISPWLEQNGYNVEKLKI